MIEAGALRLQAADEAVEATHGKEGRATGRRAAAPPEAAPSSAPGGGRGHA
jgi:hypothetical protein